MMFARYGKVVGAVLFSMVYIGLGALALSGWLGNSDDPGLAVAAYSWTVAVWIAVRTFYSWHMTLSESVIRIIGGLVYAFIPLLRWPAISLALIPPVIEFAAMSVSVWAAKRERRAAEYHLDGLGWEARTLSRISRPTGAFR